MNKGILVVVSGFSGAGKGTVMKRLMEKYDGYALSVSATTRKPRPGEEDGREYFFRTRDEFEKLIEEDALLEYARYVENYYGTPRSYVEEQLQAGRNVILEIEIQGAMKIKEKIPEALLVFVTPPTVEELERRLTGRGIPVSCEVDIYGALSEYIGLCISNDAVTLLDINNSVPQYIYDEDIKGKYDYKLTDTFMGFHCGNTPACKMCDSRAVKYQLIQHRLLEPAGSEPDFTRGTLEGDIAASDITFYRLQCNSEGELVSYVAEGEVLDVPTRSFGGIGIFAIKEMGRFYRHVLIEGNYPHHGAVMFGHYGKAFYEVVKFLGLDVKKIGYNQPAGVRYPTENPWG